MGISTGRTYPRRCLGKSGEIRRGAKDGWSEVTAKEKYHLPT